ncbi:hypothetical protein N9954_00995 [Maribacter sp.]|nr:hypothetical protein [Maribacter sp.]
MLKSYSINVLLGMLLFIGLSTLNAQKTGPKIIESNVRNPDDILLLGAPRALSEEIEGSPHISEDFLPARINELKNTQFVRYNAALDIMEILDENDATLVLSKAISYRIVLKDGSGKIYENHAFNVDGEIKSGYFNPIGELSQTLALYKKENIRFIKGKLAKSSLEQDVPSKFKREKDTYFFKKTEVDEMEELPSSKNAFIKKFDKKNLKVYMKKNKLDFRNEKNLIAILTYYFQ